MRSVMLAALMLGGCATTAEPPIAVHGETPGHVCNAAAVANYSGSNYMIFRSHSAVLPRVQSSLPSIADNPRRVLVSVRDDRAHSNTR